MAKNVLSEGESADPVAEVVYISLQQFADNNARLYGVELMGGFFYDQESSNKFADTEENYHSAIKSFAQKEVK